jgi:enoyl-CoA hydratase/carnithine racemase
MAYEFILVQKKGHLTILTINRPEVMNALHPPAHQEMDAAFNEFSEDPDAWVAIISGAGDRAFSAGNDLKWHAQHGIQAIRQTLDSLKGGFGGITRRFDCFKPVIAAVNGYALGGGFEVILACDIIIAVEHASFGLPEVQFGLMAAAGGVHRLTRNIPYHIAMGMILTGHRISAHEAHQMGLVNEVVSADKLVPAAERWANKIIDCAPLSVRASKEAALKGLDLPLETSIRTVFPGMLKMSQSEDYVNGPRAFANKKKPKWKGK